MNFDLSAKICKKNTNEGAIIEDLVYYTSTLKFLHQNLFYIAWWQKDYYTITFLLLHYTLALNCTSFHNADAFLASFFLSNLILKLTFVYTLFSTKERKSPQKYQVIIVRDVIKYKNFSFSKIWLKRKIFNWDV